MTSPSCETPRTSVWLVVGDPPAASLLQESCERPVIRVEHYLQALGEMAHRDVAGVIGGLEPMGRGMEPALRALRELSRDARLLLVVDADEEPEAMRAVRLGFDDYLVRPLRPGELARALGAPSAASAPPVAPLRLEESAPTPSAAQMKAGASPGSRVHEPRDEWTLEEAEPRGMPSTDRPRPAREQAMSKEHAQGPPPLHDDHSPPHHPEAPIASDPPPPPPLGADHPIGDVDLIARLLEQHPDFRNLALGVIARKLDDPTVRLAEHADPRTTGCAAVRYQSRDLGYLLSETRSEEELAAYAGWLGHWLMLERRIVGLGEMAYRDPLTGLSNRRHFDQTLASLLRRARDQRFRVTLMLYDIDHFKSYNDAYGHPAGDEILQQTAQLMRCVVRKQDVVARIGGDEFAVILWDAEAPRRAHSKHPRSVESTARRFEQAIRRHRFPKLKEQAAGALTLSGGLASYPWDGHTPGQLIDVADHALLESKRSGKNTLTFGPGGWHGDNRERR